MYPKLKVYISEAEKPHDDENTCEGQISKGQISTQRPKWFRWAVLGSILATIAGIFFLIWFAFALTLLTRLRPHKSTSGLQRIVDAWREPSDSTRLVSQLSTDFSRDVIPKQCHSHNDYWRKVPLFEALAAGCTSVEADIWLPINQENGTDLRVGHTTVSLISDRTLSSLYISPLNTIMHNLANPSGEQNGIFQVNPNQTLTLLLDFKSNGTDLWPLVNNNLETLRNGGWLSHWNGTSDEFVSGPITIVATGNAPFDLITANTTYRDIFYDAPLADLDSNKYNSSNSFFASASMTPAIGKPTLLGHLSKDSLDKLDSQVTNAQERGLQSRYWDTPSWPISARDRVWNTFMSHGVSILNVDDLESATRWNWDWCVVAGFVLCG